MLFVSLVSPILPSLQVRAVANDAQSSLEVFDNGTLSLNAKGLSLGSILGKIQEKSNLEFRIHENFLKQPVFLTFKSLPLNDAIKRILHGVSYVCIFDSKGNVEKLITFSNRTKSTEKYFPKSVQEGEPPYRGAERIMPFPQMEDITEAMIIEAPPELDRNRHTP